MGEVVRFWDYKRETLPATPFDSTRVDLRDRPSARVYVMPSTHVLKPIYPSAKLLPPLMLPMHSIAFRELNTEKPKN